jgi:hypothetical protein
LKVDKKGTNTDTIHTFQNIEYRQGGYNVVLGASGDLVEVFNNFNYTPDGFSGQNSYGNVISEAVPFAETVLSLGGEGGEQLGALTPTIVSVTWTQDKLRELLGFNENLIITAIKHTFHAGYQIVSLEIPNSITIKLTNVTGITSYDSVSKRKEPIIGMIPINILSVSANSTFDYLPPVLTYVSFNNPQSIQLNSFNFTITDSVSRAGIDFNSDFIMLLSLKS